MTDSKSTSYRPDIDGLRAIAVLAVLFYHFGWKPFGGGFIGVDVFFVISGFLITGMILRDIEGNKFSLVRFYERRIRRIFPALFVMLLVVLAAGAWLYDPPTFLDHGKSTIAAATSWANIYFWSTVGYFDAPPLLKPLLHTWSLSVEEQFYLVLPLTLLLITRYVKKHALWAVIGLFLLSLGLNVWVTGTDPNTAFYMPYLRAWELLAGGLIAMRPVKLKPAIAEATNLLGLAAVIAPIFLYTENTPFPGWAALAPVLGTAVIINNGIYHQGVTAKVLSLSPAVFIGKISYSLYLWHWPMLVFTKLYWIVPMGPRSQALLLIAILGISILSWRFVETPFRSHEFLPGRRIFVFAGTVTAVVVMLGAVVALGNGLEQRWGVLLTHIDADNASQQHAMNQCDNRRASGGELRLCPIGNSGAVASFAVWGDSHAASLMPGFALLADEYNVRGTALIGFGCPPLLADLKRGSDCERFESAAIAYIAAHPELKTVILPAKWWKYALYPNRSWMLGDGSDWILRRGLTATVKRLQQLGRRVVIVESIPKFTFDVPAINAVAVRTGRNLNLTLRVKVDDLPIEAAAEQAAMQRILDTHQGVFLVNLLPVLCPGGVCMLVQDGAPIYMDNNHLSRLGAELVAPQLAPIFSAMEKP